MKDFLGSPIAYYPALATLFCGDVKAALFVSQFLYWQKIKGEGEEIYKTIAELKRETGLSREEQDRIIKALVAAELLTVKVKGTPPKRYFGFDWAKITAGLSALNAKENISELKQIRAAFAQKSVTKGNNQFAANTQIEMRETHKSICVKGTNEFAGKHTKQDIYYNREYYKDYGQRISANRAHCLTKRQTLVKKRSKNAFRRNFCKRRFGYG
jgi:hypothetical protein